MSDDYELTAEPRTDVGKGASRRLRRAGRVPGIIYGARKNPSMITVDHNQLTRQLANEAFYSHILTVSIGKKKEKVILKDLQRHPSKPFIMHMDLQRVSAREKIKVLVPLHFLGEETSPAIKLSGGIISHNLTELEISCLPKDLPEFIDIEVSDKDVGDVIHVSDVVLPEGVELANASDAEDIVLAVYAKPTEEEIEEEEGLEAAEPGEGEEPGEAEPGGEKEDESKD